MKTKFRVLQRAAYTVAAVGLLVVVAFPALHPSLASAAQLSQRSITLSDSGPSGGTITSGVGSGTNVTYQVSFTTFATAQSLIIDFCAEDPIIGDACSTPTGMNASTAAIGTTTSGNITAAGWTVTPSTDQVRIAKASGSNATAGSQVFTLTGIVNPSTTGSYFARIYTYANNSYGTYNDADVAAAPGTGPGNYLDYGGIALSTNQIITITARVQEQLTFCVSGAAQATWTTPTNTATDDCSTTEAATAPALTLGHGSPTKILDSSATDTGTVYSQLSTNATNGAVIAMRNSNTTCGGLSANGGTTCDIPATASGVGTAASAITAGVAAFGMRVATSATTAPGATGTVLLDTNYNNGANTYGMDTETTTDVGSVTGTFGDRVAYCTAPVYRANNEYQFAATASLTTPAGIYVANMDLIATGTF